MESGEQSSPPLLIPSACPLPGRAGVAVRSPRRTRARQGGQDPQPAVEIPLDARVQGGAQCKRSVYEATSDHWPCWVGADQGPATLPVITQAAVFSCWVDDTRPRGPAGLVHCGWDQWRLLCISHQPVRAKRGYLAAVGTSL